MEQLDDPRGVAMSSLGIAQVVSGQTIPKEMLPCLSCHRMMVSIMSPGRWSSEGDKIAAGMVIEWET